MRNRWKTVQVELILVTTFNNVADSLDNGPSYFREKYIPNSKQSRIHHALGNAEAMITAV